MGLMNSAQILQYVERYCRDHGLRFTAARRLVMELIVAADKPIKAYDLLDQMRQKQPSAAPPTVYRALDFLLSHHFIHRLESLNAFISCVHPNHHHQHGYFLICDDCNAVVEVEDSALSQKMASAAQDHNFESSHEVLEIHGRCEHCQD